MAADGTTPKLAKALGKGTKRTGTPTYGEIGMSIQGEGLIELIHDPLKFYEKLSGSKNITGAKRVGDITVPTGATRSKGVISKVTKQVDNLLSQVKLRITKQDMADDIRKRMLHKYYDAASGNLDPEDIRTREEVIGQHFGRGGDAFVESAQTKSKLSKHADAELVKKANAESSLSPLEDLENILEQESISP